MNKALAGVGMLAVTAAVLVSGCSTSSTPAVSSSASVAARANADSGDCLFGIFGADVEDGGEMPYGSGTCTREEQDGWKSEATPGPLARQAQQAHPAAAQAPAPAASAAA